MGHKTDLHVLAGDATALCCTLSTPSFLGTARSLGSMNEEHCVNEIIPSNEPYLEVEMLMFSLLSA